jgi:translocation and assembly module TamB
MSADVVTPPPITPPLVPAAPANPAQFPPPRRRRWLRRLLPLFTLLVLGTWFAPAIVANTGLRNRLAREALANLHGSVEVGGASLGWFAPIELRDVTLKDNAGRTIVNVPKITSEKTLLDLARNPAVPGGFALESPTVALVCEKNTTNLEAALAEYLKDDDTPRAPTRTPVSVRVTGATLTLSEAATGNSATVENISAQVDVPADRTSPVTAKVTAATGKLDAQVSVGASGSVNVVCSDLPLGVFAPLLNRADPDLKLAGAATTDLQVTWGPGPTIAVLGTASVKQLALSTPWLKGDTLALDSAALPLDVELAGRVVRVRKFELVCDAGTLSAAGTYDPDQPADKLLAQAGVSVHADVDLARLAAKLPKLLRVKDGTELREGKFVVGLVSRADGAGVVWEGKVGASALKGARAGQPIAWDQPLNLEFAARYVSGQLPTFDKLICTSDFLALNARVTSETVQAAANIYLHRLGERLGQFVDFGGGALDGEATAQLVARRNPDGAFQSAGAVALKDFAFTDRAGKGVKEPSLKLQFTAAGKAPPKGPVELTTATVALAAGADELRLTLLEPVGDVKKLSSGSVDVRASGDLGRWKDRLSAVASLPPYQMSGGAAVNGRATFTSERITVERLTVSLTNVVFRGAALNLDEPTLSAVGDLTLTRATNTATVSQLTLTSAPLSVTNGTLTLEPVKNEVAVSGTGQCAIDLNRLGATLKLYPDSRGPDALGGRGLGVLRFRYASDVTTFGGTLDVTNLTYGPKSKPVWTEPALHLELDGSYSDPSDTVSLAVAKVERPGLAVDAKGAIAKVSTTQEVKISSTVRYDWAQLAPLVRELLGGNFTATGSGSRPFAFNVRLAGTQAALSSPKPPTPPVPGALGAAEGEIALGWDTIRTYGFDVGAGELKAKLTKGVAAVAPITATFCGGKVTLAPTVKLDTAPGEVVMAKGPFVDHAKLTPKATAGALGYALPAIANAGQAEGEISATMDENHVPFGDVTRANIKCTLLIHKATVGASPLTAELANLLGAKSTQTTLTDEQFVPVQVANGRVYHQGFAFKVSGTTLHTTGSVGFDDTLDLIVDIPLPKELPELKNNPLGKTVAGKVVQVPVKGTLSKPALDAKAFERAVAALIHTGAKDASNDALNKELDKLLPSTNPK